MKLSKNSENLLQICRVKFMSQRPDTTEQIVSILDEYKRIFPVDDNELRILKRYLIADFGVTKDDDMTLISKESYIGQDNDWFVKLRDSEGKYDRRSSMYFASLLDKKWPTKVISEMQKSSDDIMNRLGDPRREEFDIRGLLMGEVQSGKTANFLAICNKAADIGYRVIIVTTGIIEKLRQQTQGRLEKEFSKLIHAEEIPALTTVECDFRKNRTDHPVSFFRDDRPVLCVIKKNVNVLRHLHTWLQKDVKNGKLKYPLLFIDDEADNAGINVGMDESNPTQTNKWIRKILNSFKRSSYLAITATPFANIFIDPDAKGEDLGKDLFPESFARRLTSSSDYCGAKRIFADESLYLRDINDIEEWLPVKHKKDFVPSPELPLSLKRSIAYYLLLNAVMDVLSEECPITPHRTMLIHISRFIAIQKKVQERVQIYVNQVKHKISLYASDYKKAMQYSEFQFLQDIWNEECISEMIKSVCDRNVTWEEFVVEYLHKGIESVDVKVINSKEKGNLDFSNESVRTIVVGGNALSRGLTIEGLAVSYFRRNTMFSDTLLQMARWFGYRGFYQPFVRIWIEASVLDSFAYAIDLIDEVSEQFDIMASTNATPREFALKLRKSPLSLLPTARNKLRSATTVRLNFSFSGHSVETPRIPNEKEAVQNNANQVANFFEILKNANCDDGGRCNRMRYYRNISVRDVCDFLSGFKSGLMSYGCLMNAIIPYILTYTDRWDVAVRINRAGSPNNPDAIRESKRVIKLDTDNEVIQISGTKLKVSSGGSMKYILHPTECEGLPSTKDEIFLKKAGELHRNPILMIHKIKAKDQVQGVVADEFYAVSIGFPGDRNNNETGEYILSKAAYERYLGLEEEE